MADTLLAKLHGCFEPFCDPQISCCKEMCLLYTNNKGADQPAHFPNLISTSIIQFLEGTRFNLTSAQCT